MSVYEILSLVIGSINIVSLIFLVIQIGQAKKQKKDAHEELRRIKTVEVVYNWNSNLKKETRLAEKVVESLDSKKCAALYENNPFDVPQDIHDMICQMCSKDEITCKQCMVNPTGNYTVSGLPLTELRGNVTSYLNNLEIVAMAWRQGVVDKEEIELQFAYLYDPSKKSALSEYRKVAGGGNSYPDLALLYEKIKNNKTPIVSEKEKQN